MRLEAGGLVVIGLALSLSSCQRAAVEPPPQCPPGQVCMVPPSSLGDEVAGCDAADPAKGAPLVKIKIKLKADQGRCSVESVKPERVCVTQGGVIRWKIHSDCDLPAETALGITKVRWLKDACVPVLKPVRTGSDKKNVILCGVPDDTDVDDYPYDVEVGDEAGFDPWIEVKRDG